MGSPQYKVSDIQEYRLQPKALKNPLIPPQVPFVVVLLNDWAVHSVTKRQYFVIEYLARLPFREDFAQNQLLVFVSFRHLAFQLALQHDNVVFGGLRRGTKSDMTQLVADIRHFLEHDPNVVLDLDQLFTVTQYFIFHGPFTGLVDVCLFFGLLLELQDEILELVVVW